jgi:20S proteasome alpha/beta subunit
MQAERRYNASYRPDGECGKKASEPKGGRGVTQIIGALCDKGRAVVGVSDRMISGLFMAYEPPMMKVRQLTHKAVVLTAGNPATIPEVVDRVAAYVDTNEVKVVAKMVRALGDSFQQARKRHIEANVLAKHAGVTGFDMWHERQQKMDPRLVAWVNGQVSDFGLGLTLLVLGIDPSGWAHIHRINDAVVDDCYDMQGYCCEGVGTMHATTTFVRHGYHPDMSITDALYIAFEAKKMAELAPGVGKATDVLLIDKHGTKRLTSDCVKELERRYDKRMKRAKGKGLGADLDGFGVDAELWLEWLDGRGATRAGEKPELQPEERTGSDEGTK